MITIYDRAAMAAVPALNLDPQLAGLLMDRIAHLPPDLVDWTEFVAIEPDDTEADIAREVGFSPLIEPIDGARFGGAGFNPFWDYLSYRDGWWEMIVTFGSTFATVLLVPDAIGVLPELRAMCCRYSRRT